MLAYKAKKRKAKDGLSKSRDGKSKGARRKPVLDDFVGDRDFEGALALLEFNLKSGERTDLTNWWIGYCAFHLGRYQRAIEAYEDQLRELDRPGAGARSEGKRSDAEEKSGAAESSDARKKSMAEWPRDEQEAMLNLHLACCRFYLGGELRCTALQRKQKLELTARRRLPRGARPDKGGDRRSAEEQALVPSELSHERRQEACAVSPKAE